MPLSYDIDVAARLVVLTCGNTTLDRWRETMLAIFADSRYQPDFAKLFDCRTATLAPATEDVRGVVDFISSHTAMLGRSRWAVVVERSAGYGMARMAEALAHISNVELRAYQTPGEALTWLSSALEQEGE
jgi:hypothetical protein